MEIEKELRLPFGSKSWWDVLQVIPYQDEIPLKDQKPQKRVWMDYDPMNWADLPVHESERFEADVLTLKVRAFDELKEIIPDKRVLMETYHALNRSNMGYHKESLDFIEKLINLM